MLAGQTNILTSSCLYFFGGLRNLAIAPKAYHVGTYTSGGFGSYSLWVARALRLAFTLPRSLWYLTNNCSFRRSSSLIAQCSLIVSWIRRQAWNISSGSLYDGWLQSQRTGSCSMWLRSSRDSSLDQVAMARPPAPKVRRSMRDGQPLMDRSASSSRNRSFGTVPPLCHRASSQVVSFCWDYPSNEHILSLKEVSIDGTKQLISFKMFLHNPCTTPITQCISV